MRLIKQLIYGLMLPVHVIRALFFLAFIRVRYGREMARAVREGFVDSFISAFAGALLWYVTQKGKQDVPAVRL